MANSILAGVALQNVSFSIDKAYDYAVPAEFAKVLQIGCRVLVPFGRGNAQRQGIVLSLRTADEENNKIKPVAAVLDEVPLLGVSDLALAAYMKDRTFCTIFDAVKTMLPQGINRQTQLAYGLASLPEEEEGEGVAALSPEEKLVVEYLRHRKGAVKAAVILADLQLTEQKHLLNGLLQKGILYRDYSAVRTVNDATVKMVKLLPEYQSEEALLNPELKLTKRQTEVALELLRLGVSSVKELCYFTGAGASVVSNLQKRGVAECFEQEVYRRPHQMNVTDTSDIVLSPEQQSVYRALQTQWENGGGVSLLYGVTGSGKTQVYLKMINTMVEQEKSVIVMVPEISLTPQTLKLFYSRYGSKVAVFHSALSAGERLDEWKRVKKGEATIVVGTRSAVFAPVQNLGLIVMDEEQEHTYQSEMNPRYHARDIAKYRVAEQSGVLILASATPSFDSYASAMAGKYQLLELPKRYGTANLPEVTIADMRREQKDGNQTQISKVLFSAMNENLIAGRQSILLLNRRGYHTYAECNACGEVVTCPNCSISLTYHRANRRLMCHYCGYSVPFTNVCTSCGAADVRYSGLGTQRLEEELEELFPTARILRMDADSTMQKNAYDEKLSAFATGKYDIMMGTQMVAKGLDFENVTLVGVLSADNELYSDDYKSLEHTFDLITQVVGRAGRGKYPGKAVIQTKTPENEVLKLAARQDYKRFYQTEIQLRKAMVYPPYCTLCSIEFRCKKASRAEQSAGRFMSLLKTRAAKDAQVKLIALGPMPEAVFKVSGQYRYRILLKCKNNQAFRTMLQALLTDFHKDGQNGGVRTVISIEN